LFGCPAARGVCGTAGTGATASTRGDGFVAGHAAQLRERLTHGNVVLLHIGEPADYQAANIPGY